MADILPSRRGTGFDADQNSIGLRFEVRQGSALAFGFVVSQWMICAYFALPRY
jgi:hypothetical protein